MSSGLICGGCGRGIIGQYIEALGQNWHPECFRCAGCGQPLGEQRFAVRDDRPYHPACYEEKFGLRCAACGGLITDQYVEQEGAAYHPDCHKARFGLRCAACDGFIEGRYVQHEGRPYHPDCHKQQFGKRCAVCGEYIEGQYIQTFWGDVYCARHKTEYPECYVCQRPVCKRLTGGGKQYQDGRVVCMLCRKQAVDDQAQARTIMQQVQARMVSYGLDTRQVPIPLAMVKLTQLTAEGMAGPLARLQGQTRKQVQTLNGQEVARAIEAVYVLGGLPPIYLENVLAHELGHVWLFMQHIDDLPEDLEEGLCNLFAYLLHQEQASPETRHCLQLLEENPDPIYGDGFRRARAVYEKRGLPALLRGVAQHRRWPRE